jgi:shikimate dehydrogenase
MDVYGLIGYPLGHSFSKRYFTEKFEKENISSCVFKLFPLEDISDLKSLISSEATLKGLAVTIPYKEAVLPYLDLLDKEAARIAAVNCIKISNGILTGYNTDVVGFERSLVPLLQRNHTKALVLGTGGASRAVQFVLTKLGIHFLIVTRKTLPGPEFINYNLLDEKIVKEYPVIINCTPVGMSPNEDALPMIPYEYLDNKNLLYDLVYTPSFTGFLQKGAEKAATVKNGYEMLAIQAEENWRIWNEL